MSAVGEGFEEDFSRTLAFWGRAIIGDGCLTELLKRGSGRDRISHTSLLLKVTPLAYVKYFFAPQFSQVHL
jgi:hypothetical protein